jgi:hypothetical protein
MGITASPVLVVNFSYPFFWLFLAGYGSLIVSLAAVCSGAAHSHSRKRLTRQRSIYSRLLPPSTSHSQALLLPPRVLPSIVSPFEVRLPFFFVWLLTSPALLKTKCYALIGQAGCGSQVACSMFIWTPLFINRRAVPQSKAKKAVYLYFHQRAVVFTWTWTWTPLFFSIEYLSLTFFIRVILVVSCAKT